MEGDAPLSIAFNNNNIDVVEYFVKLKVLKQGNIRRKDDFNKLKKCIKGNIKDTKDQNLQGMSFQYKDNRLKKTISDEDDVGINSCNRVRSRNSRANVRRR